MAFRHDGQAILTGSYDCTARVWSTQTGYPISPRLEHGDQVECVAFSSDGRMALTGGTDDKICRWDVETGLAAGPPTLSEDDLLGLIFSPNGKFFVSRGRLHAVRLWDASSGRRLGEPLGNNPARNVIFSSDSKVVFAIEEKGLARAWDLSTDRPIEIRAPADDKKVDQSILTSLAMCAGDNVAAVLNGWSNIVRDSRGWQLSDPRSLDGLNFSPDRRHVLIQQHDRSPRLWDISINGPLGEPLPVTTSGRAVFSPDGRFVAIACSDNTVRLWETASRRVVGSPLRHRLQVLDVAFSPDGKMIATSSADGTAKVWEFGLRTLTPVPRKGEVLVATTDPGGVPSPPRMRFTRAAFSPDRTRVLVGDSWYGLARQIDTATAQPLDVSIPHRWSRIRTLQYSPDGSLFVTASHVNGRKEQGTSTTCQIWNTLTGRPQTGILPHINYVSAAAFRGDGKVLATGDYSGVIHFWDVATGEQLTAPLRAGSIVFSMAYSPDGQMLVAGTAETARHAVLWDLSDGRRRGEPFVFKGIVAQLAFSPDGKRLAIGSEDTTVRLVDVSTGQAIGEPLVHADHVRGLAFSPDNRVLLSASKGPDGTGGARLWNAATGEAESPTIATGSAIADGAIAFSPDSSAFVVGCEDGSVSAWNVNHAQPVGPAELLRGSILGVAFHPDGKSWVAVDDYGDVRSCPLPVASNSPVEALITQTALQSGVTLDKTREFSLIDTEAWRCRCATRSTATRASFVAGRDNAMEARAAELCGDAFGALWHLNRLIAAHPKDCLLHARRALALLSMGEPERAAAALEQAVRLGPPKTIVDWLSCRSEDLLAAGRPGDALCLLNVAIAARPAAWQLRAARAAVYSALGRRDEREVDLAAAVERGADIAFLARLAEERFRSGQLHAAIELYDSAIARGTVPYEVWTQAAIAHLKADDLAGYQQLCEALRARYRGRVAEKWVATLLAEMCILGQGGVQADGETAMAWAESALDEFPPGRADLRHSVLTTMGGIHYRSGRFREAIDRINEGIASDNGQISETDAIFLAMAHQQLGGAAAAQDLLASHPPEETTWPDAYWNLEYSRQLRREALRLILDPMLPSDVFAH